MVDVEKYRLYVMMMKSDERYAKRIRLPGGFYLRSPIEAFFDPPMVDMKEIKERLRRWALSDEEICRKYDMVIKYNDPSRNLLSQFFDDYRKLFKALESDEALEAAYNEELKVGL